MALAKLDDDGGPVPPPTKGNSSPPPNGGSSSKNQPSNSNNGKKPESGKNTNKTQPEAKKPAATQPVTAPKGETLEQAIVRMRNQDVPEWQIKAQIKKWHPTWTDAQITKTMKAAPGPGGYIDKAKANAAKGKSSGHGGGIKELKRDVAAVTRIVHSAERVAGADLRRDRRLARIIQHDVDREARRIAHVTTKAISRDLERDRRLLHDIRREVAKQSDRLSRDIERAVPRIERRIEHDLALLDKDVLRHLPSAQAIAQWTGTISSFAALAGLVLPPPADVAAEAIAIGLAEVSITASTVDAIKHPNDPGRTVDALVQIGLVRLGVSGSTTDERRVRAAAALISQLYYDFLRKGH